MARRSSCIRRRNISAAMAPRSAASSSMAAISTGRRMPTRFPMLNTPDPTYHGAVWTQAVKPLGPDRLHHQGARHAAARPRRGDEPVQRLPVHPGAGDAAAAHARSIAPMPRRSRSISASSPKVTKVIYPGLMTSEAKRRADAYLKGGYGGLVGFELKGGKDAGRRFIDCAEDVLPRRQYRRRAQPGDPSGHDHAFAALAGGADRRPASPTAMCACRSASSTSTTSSPISTRR